MASFAGAARFLLLNVLGFYGNHPSTADAASASPVSGWRSDLDWAALSSKLSSSASLSTLPTMTTQLNVDRSLLSLARQIMH
eukprot:scaffold14144_cov91-Skeletonema_dohrnii-CCMP3373.AAC.16